MSDEAKRAPPTIVVVFSKADGEKMQSYCNSDEHAVAFERQLKRMSERPGSPLFGCHTIYREIRDAAWHAARDKRLSSAVA